MAHVGDVHDALDRIADIAQIFLQNVFHNIGTQIPDMGVVIYRGSAGIHLDEIGMIRDKEFLFTAGRVVKIHATRFLSVDVLKDIAVF